MIIQYEHGGWWYKVDSETHQRYGCSPREWPDVPKVSREDYLKGNYEELPQGTGGPDEDPPEDDSD